MVNTTRQAKPVNTRHAQPPQTQTRSPSSRSPMTPRYRQLRQDANRSQQELADYLHISQGQYGKIERQESRITDDKLLMLAQYYQTSTSYLLGETDDPTPPGGDPEDKLPPLDPIKEGILDEYRKLDQPGKHALYTIAVALRHAQERRRLQE